jgi:hypothetical protein
MAATASQVETVSQTAQAAHQSKSSHHSKFSLDSISSDDPSKVDWSIVENGNCLVVKDGWGFKACTKGDTSGPWNVAFIGDSHMRQYFTPLDVLAFRYHWKVTYISKSACPVANHDLYPIQRYPDYSCRSWNRSLERYLKSKPPFDLVVNSNSAFDSHGNIEMARAFKNTVLSQTTRGTKWLVISDNPKPQPNFQKCIADNPAKAEHVCRIPYSKAMKPADVLPRAVHAIAGVTVADFRATYCPHMCPAVINGITVYRDYSHISKEWSKQMLGKLDAAVPSEFKSAPTTK